MASLLGRRLLHSSFRSFHSSASLFFPRAPFRRNRQASPPASPQSAAPTNASFPRKPHDLETDQSLSGLPESNEFGQSRSFDSQQSFRFDHIRHSELGQPISDPCNPDSDQASNRNSQSALDAESQQPICVEDVLSRSLEGLRSRELLFMVSALRAAASLEQNAQLLDDPRCQGLVARAVLAAPHLDESECLHLAKNLHDLRFSAKDRPLDALFHLLHHHAPYLDLHGAITLGNVIRGQKWRLESPTPAMVALEEQLQILVSSYDIDCIAGMGRKKRRLFLTLFGDLLSQESLAVLRKSKEISDGAR